MPDETDQSLTGKYHNAKVILIVEDDEAIGAFLVDALQEVTPYRVMWVTDGFAALKVAHDVKPDLLVLDYQLPHMDGIEVYDQLRTRPELMEVPAIVMTALPGMPRHALEKRRLVGISKPFELAEFLEMLDKLLAVDVREG